MILISLLPFCYKDVNECTNGNHSCEHNCHNTNGSYTCSCNTGYSLSSNGLSCNGKKHTLKTLFLHKNAV